MYGRSQHNIVIILQLKIMNEERIIINPGLPQQGSRVTAAGSSMSSVGGGHHRTRDHSGGSSPACPHLPCLFPQGIQMCGQELCTDLPEAGHVPGAHQEPPGGAELPLPPLWQGLPLAIRPGRASVLTQPPATAQPQEGQRRLQVRDPPSHSPQEAQGSVPLVVPTAQVQWDISEGNLRLQGPAWGSGLALKGQKMWPSLYHSSTWQTCNLKKKILKKGSCFFLVHSGKKICFSLK